MLGPVRPPHDRAAEARLGRADDQVARQRADRGVVAVRLVSLEHRELGIVCRIDSLVAEVPADLVDLLQAADHQPLQVQFERDPQVQPHVVGVDVSHERPCVGATMQGLQHRRLRLDEALAVQFLPDSTGYRGTKLGEPPGFRIDNQIDITHAHPRLRIAKAGVLVGKRAQGLGRDREGFGEHGQLTTA